MPVCFKIVLSSFNLIRNHLAKIQISNLLSKSIGDNHIFVLQISFKRKTAIVNDNCLFRCLYKIEKY